MTTQTAPASDEEVDDFFELLQSFGCESQGGPMAPGEDGPHLIRCAVCYGPWAPITGEIRHDTDCSTVMGPKIKARLDQSEEMLKEATQALERLGSMQAFYVGTCHVDPEVIERVDFARALLARFESMTKVGKRG